MSRSHLHNDKWRRSEIRVNPDPYIIDQYLLVDMVAELCRKCHASGNWFIGPWRVQKSYQRKTSLDKIAASSRESLFAHPPYGSCCLVKTEVKKLSTKIPSWSSNIP